MPCAVVSRGVCEWQGGRGGGSCDCTGSVSHDKVGGGTDGGHDWQQRQGSGDGNDADCPVAAVVPSNRRRLQAQGRVLLHRVSARWYRLSVFPVLCTVAFHLCTSMFRL